MNETMIAAPSTTIWGRVQHREKLANGVYSVETASHGGVVVHHLVADKYISDKAKAILGERDGAWYSFEEDCDVYLFSYENMGMLALPQGWTKADVEDGVKRWHPEYFTMTAQQIRDEREARHKAEREAYERTVAESRKQDAFRRELLDHDWSKGDKVYQCDGYTVSIGKPDSAAHDYPCTFTFVNGEERTAMLYFDMIYAILTAEKKNNN